MNDLSKKKRGFRYIQAAAAADKVSVKSPKPSYVDRRQVSVKTPSACGPGRKR